MARQHDLNGRQSGWRDLVLAGGGAAAVVLLLVAGVALVWLLGRSPSDAPALGAPPPSTPTPRALSFSRETPPATPAPAATSTPPAPIAEEGGESAPDTTASPELLAMVPDDQTAPAGTGALFSASSASELTALASGSWSSSADGLQNTGSNAVAEPWLTLASVPNAAFAVEAEIRVSGRLDSVCDQSFGLAGGNPDTDQMYGGGILFPCDSAATRARLTDVTVWQDGYNADPVVTEKAFDPGDDWRTYRFEVRGDRLRLIVDGVGIVSGSRTEPNDPSAEAETGLWAQGVALEVRSVAVYPLPSG